MQRYYPLSQFYAKRFSVPVYKAVLDGGFTCPNLDGTISTGGCIFCDGSGAFTSSGSISKQLSRERERIHKKEKTAKLIAYFQPHTNTYGDAHRLQMCYNEALACEDVIGLSIGTRPDCLPESVLDLLTELNTKTFLTVELGLQTIHDTTAKRINRGYSFATFLSAFQSLRRRHIRVCVHLINGLPGELDQDMIETARVIGRLHPDGIKIHMLHVLRGTPLEIMWEKGKVPLLSMGEYVQIVCAQLALLPKDTVIERLTGDGELQNLLAPKWTIKKSQVRNAILQHLKQTENWQGKYFSER